jgi:hypothetical protein
MEDLRIANDPKDFLQLVRNEMEDTSWAEHTDK